MIARFIFIPVILAMAVAGLGQTGKPDSLTNSARELKVILLGTGTPQPVMDRFGPAILVQAGDENLLFDAGRGCLQRLNQLGLPYNKLTAVFFTHLHSDHVVGLPDLWLTGSLLSQRVQPFQLYGPAGTGKMIEYLQKAFSFDVGVRTDNDPEELKGFTLLAVEIKQGTVYEKHGVKVIAFEVDHFPVTPAFGYRIEYKGRVVILSGDTRYSENLIKYSTGSDLLIHEVAIAPVTLGQSEPGYNILTHHTSPEQAGTIFKTVKPKLAVYSHIISLYKQTEQELLRRTKTNYSGPLVSGTDLMSFTISDTIAVKPWLEK